MVPSINSANCFEIARPRPVPPYVRVVDESTYSHHDRLQRRFAGGKLIPSTSPHFFSEQKCIQRLLGEPKMQVLDFGMRWGLGSRGLRVPGFGFRVSIVVVGMWVVRALNPQPVSVKPTAAKRRGTTQLVFRTFT